MSGKTTCQTSLEKGETLNRKRYGPNSNEQLNSQINGPRNTWNQESSCLQYSLLVSLSFSLFLCHFRFSLCVYFINFRCFLHVVGDTGTQLLGLWSQNLCLWRGTDFLSSSLKNSLGKNLLHQRGGVMQAQGSSRSPNVCNKGKASYPTGG